MNALRDAIKELAVGKQRSRDIEASLAQQAMREVLRADCDAVEAAVFLIALRMKGETEEETAAIALALQQSMRKSSVNVAKLTCLADPFDGYQRHLAVSAFIPPVLAACGTPCLIHGVASAGPKFGVTAQQIYSIAGVSVDKNATTAAYQIERHGWAYLDQSQYCPQLYRLDNLRQRMIKRTVLHTTERMLMPLQAQQRTRIVVGYVHRAYPAIYAAVAKALNYDAALLDKGIEGGLLADALKPMRRLYVDFEQAHPPSLDVSTVDAVYGNIKPPRTELRGTEARDYTLRQGLAALAGTDSAFKASLVYASARILDGLGDVDDLSQAVEKVTTCLDNGRALEHFEVVCD